LKTSAAWIGAVFLMVSIPFVLTFEDVYQLLTQASQDERAGRYTSALEKLDKAAQLEPKLAELYSQRGGVQFKLGNIAKSLEDFDTQIKLHPREGPPHWRRGISLYYADKFAEGVAQFVTSDKAEPQDVENAVWHLLCNARVVGLESARKQMLKVQNDRRVPMMEVYALFAGTSTPEKVLQKATAGSSNEKENKEQLFYAHLYIGLYDEMIQQPEKSLEHIQKAASDYPNSHYMMDVARVHAKLRAMKK
jgi:lipoprotein NlpI